MSIRPSSRPTSFIMERTSASSVTSQRRANALTPQAARSTRVARASRGEFRNVIATSAPAWASRSADALPRRRAAPVTSAVLPCKGRASLTFMVGILTVPKIWHFMPSRFPNSGWKRFACWVAPCNVRSTRRKLTSERTAQSNRLTSYLKICFPQMVEWFEKLDMLLVCDLLERWPTLEELQKASPEELRTFFCQHHCHRGLRERRILAIGGTIPAGGDRAVIEAKSAVVKVIVQLIRSLLQGIAELDRKIEEVAAEHPDFFIFESLPGAGAVMAPRLLAAFGSQRDRYRSAAELQTYSGIAPVTERSGKRKWVHFRWACPKFLRQSFHEWAGHSIMQSAWARAYYQQQRDRGSDHHAAVRALAFKWIRIVFRCWKDRVAYDENKYLAALTKRGSPLSKVVLLAAGTSS